MSNINLESKKKVVRKLQSNTPNKLISDNKYSTISKAAKARNPNLSNNYNNISNLNNINQNLLTHNNDNINHISLRKIIEVIIITLIMNI